MADDGVHALQLNNVIYAPDMDANLLSICTLYDLGYEISMKPGKGGSIYKDDMLVASTIRDGKLFRLKTVQGLHARAAVTAEST
jgi:hypothetical protein